MRPEASAGTRARNFSFRRSRSAGDMAAIVGATLVLDGDLPIVVELGKCSLHRDLTGLDGFETCAAPKVAHRIDPRGFGARRGHRVDSHRAQFDAQRLLRKAAAQYVPRIGRDRAAGAHDTRHFGDAFLGLGHEEDHQSHRLRRSCCPQKAAPSHCRCRIWQAAPPDVCARNRSDLARDRCPESRSARSARPIVR